MGSDVRSAAHSYFEGGGALHTTGSTFCGSRPTPRRSSRNLPTRTPRSSDSRRSSAISGGRVRTGEIADHTDCGTRESEDILATRGVSEETIAAVSHCFRAHRYSDPVEPETTEATVLSDADNLDVLGTVGLARCFIYGDERGSPIHGPSLPPEADDTVADATRFTHVHLEPSTSRTGCPLTPVENSRSSALRSSRRSCVASSESGRRPVVGQPNPRRRYPPKFPADRGIKTFHRATSEYGEVLDGSRRR